MLPTTIVVPHFVCVTIYVLLLLLINTDDETNNFRNKSTYTKQECQDMARHMIHESALPEQCKKYNDVVVDLRRRDSDTTHPTQYLS
jgi:hypothetical protein